MSSWDTNPWSNFCDPHWELICRNKWHPGTSEISTPLEIAVGTHFHAPHDTKTTPVFLPADGEASWSLLLSLVSYYQVAQCNQKTPICVASRWQVRFEKAKKEVSTLITATTGVYLPKVVSTDLTKPDLVLTKPIGKEGMRSWSM